MQRIKQRQSAGQKIFKAVLWSLMIIYCISMLFPLIWMIYTTFKSEFEFTINAFDFPKEIAETGLSNFKKMLDIFVMPVIKNGYPAEYRFPQMFGFSVIWAFSTSLINVYFTTIVAYVMAKYRFRGREFLYALGIFVMITPIVGNFPSAMTVKKFLGVYDNMFLTVITTPSTVFSGVHFMLMFAAFKHISWTYAEAAFIDGASDHRVMYAIMIPLVLPTCAVLFVLQFLGAWNDYGTFIIWLPSYPTLAYGMLTFQANADKYGATVPEIMAGFTLVAIPNIILYLAAQKLILAKFTVGGLKE